MKIGYFPMFMFVGYFRMFMFTFWTDLKGYKENMLISKWNKRPLKLTNVTEMSISPL